MLSKRIVYLRKKSGISQAQLAKELNISASAAGMYEQGRRTPNLDVLVMLAQYFGVSLDYLITGSERLSNGSGIQNDATTCPCQTCCWRQQ